MDLVKEITGLLEKYGIDVLLIVAVIFLTYVLKSFDVKNKFKPGYVVFPLLSSIVVVGASEWISSHSVDPVMILVYGGVSAWLYDLYSSYKATRKAKGK